MAPEFSKSGTRIESLEDWRSFAPPKGGARQWEDGRSAKELARAWCEGSHGPALPVELLAMFRSHPAFSSIEVLKGFPEDRIQFDEYPGEPRNADLNLLGQIGSERVAVSIEGKADESFGPSARGALRAAAKRRRAGKATNGAARIRVLVDALFPEAGGTRRSYLDLPYQLLTATAGTFALANRFGAAWALLVIHEFVGGTRADGTPATRASAVARNAAVLDRFVSALAGSPTPSAPGRILGPFSVPGNLYIPRNVRFFIGKIRRTLTRAGA